MANSIKFMNEGFESKYGNIKPDLCEQIYTVLKRLTEANISPEDEADTKLLYSIYNKKMKRSNAQLSPEEKSVLKKYNLEDPQVSTDYYGTKRVHSKSGNSDVFEPVKKQGYMNNNVNLADRARKMKGRYDSKTGVGKYDDDYRQSYIDMKHEVDRKNYFQRNLNDIDNYYKDEEEKLLKQLDTLRKDHESSREISQRGFNTHKSSIDRMLRRESLDKLQEAISTLNERKQEWSDEDKVDSELLYRIYKKKMQNSNAQLSPKELQVLDKYNLEEPRTPKDYRGRKDVRSSTRTDSEFKGPNVFEPIKRDGYVNRNANLADRARKMDDRSSSRDGIGKYDKDYRLNYMYMKNAVNDKKYNQRKSDSIDKKYDQEESNLRARLDALKDEREQEKSRYNSAIKNSQYEINNLLKRESLLSKDVSDLKKFVINYCRDQWEDAYIDNVCDAVSRIDDLNDTEDLSDAIDSSLIYDYDRWVVIEHFADPDDFNTSQYISELADDIYNIYQIQKDTGLSTSRIANSELPNGFGRDRLINFVNQVMERIDDLEEGDELYQIEEEISNNIVNDNDLWTIIEYYADESDRENTLFQSAYNKYENDVYYVALKYYNE